MIMDSSKSLESQLLGKNRLESLMLKNVPVMPPDSVIKTFSHLTSKDIELVLTVDSEDLSAGNFVIKQGEFAKFFLDVWSDPLYRNYNFVKAETHALVSGEIFLLPELVTCIIYTLQTGPYRPMAPDDSS